MNRPAVEIRADVQRALDDEPSTNGDGPMKLTPAIAAKIAARYGGAGYFISGGQPVGHGASEQGTISDLLEQLEAA